MRVEQDEFRINPVWIGSQMGDYPYQSNSPYRWVEESTQYFTARKSPELSRGFIEQAKEAEQEDQPVFTRSTGGTIKIPSREEESKELN